MENEYILSGETENLRLDRQNSKPHYRIDDEISYKEVIFPDNSKILDIACGTGAFSEYILKHNINKNIHLEMLDNDNGRLEYLKKKLTEYGKLDNINLNFTCDDARKLPYQSNSFDAVVNRYLIHHFPRSDNSVQDFTAEAYRVLKPNGKFIVIDVIDILFGIGTTNTELKGLLDELRAVMPLDLYGSLRLPRIMAQNGFKTENISFEVRPCLFTKKSELLSEYEEWKHRFSLLEKSMNQFFGIKKTERFKDLFLAELLKDGTVLYWTKTLTIGVK